MRHQEVGFPGLLEGRPPCRPHFGAAGRDAVLGVRDRGVSFEEVLVLLEKGEALDIYENPKQEKYRGQKIYVVDIQNYAYLVPCEETETELILKTIIPSRKANKKYLERR